MNHVFYKIKIKIFLILILSGMTFRSYAIRSNPQKSYFTITHDENKYRVSKIPFAKGGEGKLYKAWIQNKKDNSRPYAFKVVNSVHLSEKEMRSIEDQAIFHSILENKRLVRMRDAFWHGSKFCMVYDYYNGDSFDLIDDNRKILLQNMVANATMIKQILEGLVFIHANNFIHGDLKWENVLFNQKGNLYISDFGFLVHSSDVINENTARGTLDYLAPEILLRKGINDRIDIWSVGMMLWQSFFQQSFYNIDLKNWEDCHVIKQLNNRDQDLLKYKEYGPKVPLEVKLRYPELMDFFARTLHPKSDQRSSAQELLGHPLIVKYAKNPSYLARVLKLK